MDHSNTKTLEIILTGNSSELVVKNQFPGYDTIFGGDEQRIIYRVVWCENANGSEGVKKSLNDNPKLHLYSAKFNCFHSFSESFRGFYTFMLKFICHSYPHSDYGWFIVSYSLVLAASIPKPSKPWKALWADLGAMETWTTPWWVSLVIGGPGGLVPDRPWDGITLRLKIMVAGKSTRGDVLSSLHGEFFHGHVRFPEGVWFLWTWGVCEISPKWPCHRIHRTANRITCWQLGCERIFVKHPTSGVISAFLIKNQP